jgi:hypothetical protein
MSANYLKKIKRCTQVRATKISRSAHSVGSREKTMNRLQPEEKSRLALYLSQNGCPVQLKSCPPGLIVEQVPTVGMNMAFDLKSGETGYLLDALITSRQGRSARIKGMQIKTP